jgi:cell division protein FtsZ
MENAEKGIDELRQFVDAFIVIPNQKLVDINERGMTLKNAFSRINNVLYNATCGIADIIIKEGYMNVDFSDVINVMQGMGKALMGIGRAKGENRSVIATQDALNSPLLDGVSIKGAKKALVNITTSESTFMFSEMTDVMTAIQEAAGNNCNIKMGVVYTEEDTEEIVITVVATGFTKENEKRDSASQRKFTKEQELPFRQQSEQPIYRPPAYNAHQYNKSISNEIETSIISGNSTQTPRGSQLKNFDPPAYERRTTAKAASEYENDEEKLKVHFIGNSPLHTIGDLEAEENLNKPAFLRKILD